MSFNVSISGPRVNFSKPVVLIVSVPPKLVGHHLPFSWAPDSIPYLGIKLSNNIDNLYMAKYPPMFRKIEKDLKMWFEVWFMLTGKD